MSNYDDDRLPQQTFDVRKVNLLRCEKLIDLEIVIAEADAAIAQIVAQVRDEFGDKRWLEDATRAKHEIEHKRRLAVMKRDVVKGNIDRMAAAAASVPEMNFKARFLQVAEEMLPTETMAKLREAAVFRVGPVAA
jgi:hypothetical protein